MPKPWLRFGCIVNTLGVATVLGFILTLVLRIVLPPPPPPSANDPLMTWLNAYGVQAFCLLAFFPVTLALLWAQQRAVLRQLSAEADRHSLRGQVGITFAGVVTAFFLLIAFFNLMRPLIEVLWIILSLLVGYLGLHAIQHRVSLGVPRGMRSHTGRAAVLMGVLELVGAGVLLFQAIKFLLHF